jgi:sugar transferase (PEP-CTERM/EpsH1 system associated)
MKTPPLIAHIIHRLAVGGMENGLVNLINNMPEGRYRHAIICMDEYTDFRFRIKRNDVAYHALHKKPGHDVMVFYRLFKLLRNLKPQIVHTRNIGTLECMLPAVVARIPCRIHGEHGRDMTDIDGSNKRYIFLRKVFTPFVQQYVAVSKDLESWLLNTIRVKKNRVSQIYNGVDIGRFAPAEKKPALPVDWYHNGQPLIVGTVGRLNGEKDQITLIRAFHRLITQYGGSKQTLRLAIIGDGPMRDNIEKILVKLKLEDKVWLAGSRDDIPQLLSALDIFVLPSKGEGISNTVLEAMASGLPVIATNVGGNPELVDDGNCGQLVPSTDSMALAQAISKYVEFPELVKQHGLAARQRVENLFSLSRMVEGYLALYDNVLRNNDPVYIKMLGVFHKNNNR